MSLQSFIKSTARLREENRNLEVKNKGAKLAQIAKETEKSGLEQFCLIRLNVFVVVNFMESKFNFH